MIAEVCFDFLSMLYSIIQKIPDINWANYDVVVPDEGLKMLDRDITSDTGNNKAKITHNRDDKTDTHNRVGDWVLRFTKKLNDYFSSHGLQKNKSDWKNYC